LQDTLTSIAHPESRGGNIGDKSAVTPGVAPSLPLTDTAIKNAKPQKKAKRHFDGGGLYLEVSPQGGKWWRLKYRFEGKEKRLSLGVYPEVSLKEARSRRDESRKMLTTGIDPAANRKAIKFGQG
jgi:hypothetical protein